MFIRSSYDPDHWSKKESVKKEQTSKPVIKTEEVKKPIKKEIKKSVYNRKPQSQPKKKSALEILMEDN